MKDPSFSREIFIPGLFTMLDKAAKHSHGKFVLLDRIHINLNVHCHIFLHQKAK